MQPIARRFIGIYLGRCPDVKKHASEDFTAYRFAALKQTPRRQAEYVATDDCAPERSFLKKPGSGDSKSDKG
ncbi:MAG: hypothetical protein JWO80_28 [Bryobacterales bacterium]|nr:hypothetical protein [Bryobacterales bacterium]